MIADFVIEKMAAYLAGGAMPETAAHYTRGEEKENAASGALAGFLARPMVVYGDPGRQDFSKVL